MNKQKILILTNFYLPGYKAGGPIQSVANMIDAIGDRYSFYIVTTDRDLYDTKQYDSIQHKEWIQHNKAYVRYLTPDEQTLKKYQCIINDTKPDLIYCQSFFNPKFTFLPLLALLFSKQRKCPVLIAPRGELSDSCIRNKHMKKTLYIVFFKYLLNRFLLCYYHGSTTEECQSITHCLGDSIQCYAALNFNQQGHVNLSPEELSSYPELHIVFFSRIDPKKNLDYSLRVLSRVKSPIKFDVFGAVSDSSYHDYCKQIAATLPKHISVSFQGSLPHHAVLTTLQKYDLLFFPTKNENFGHVIHEALCAGLPCLISDQTPWHELNTRNAGWEVSLDHPEEFAKHIEEYSSSSLDQRISMHEAALRYGMDVSNNSKTYHDNILMLDSILSSS